MYEETKDTIITSKHDLFAFFNESLVMIALDISLYLIFGEQKILCDAQIKKGKDKTKSLPFNANERYEYGIGDNG